MSYLKQKKDLPLGGTYTSTGFFGSPRKRRKALSQLLLCFGILFVVAWMGGYLEGGLASVNGSFNMHSSVTDINTKVRPLSIKFQPPTPDELEDLVTASLNMSRYALPRDDFSEMGRRARNFSKLFNIRYTPFGKERRGLVKTLGGLEKVAQVDEALQALERNMYPWIKKGKKFVNAADVLSSYSGRGIVLATGNWHFRFARHCILSMRLVGSKLPIQVFYAGPDDLSVENRNILRAIPGVEVIDLSEFVDIKEAEVNGWAVKPFSMLASNFAEMIFVDADALFFQPPEVMFEFERYKRTGAVFFRDRTIGWGMTETLEFMKTFLPNPSEYAKTEGRVLNLKSLHEGESGVIVYDKRAAFHGLLATCKMNANPWREVMYKVIHGDKESYWFSQELLELPYAWAPGGGGTVGWKEGEHVCGGLYHPDEKYKPLWWNGGVTVNKYFEANAENLMNFTHWATDRRFEKLDWQWEQEKKPFCLKPGWEEDVGELTPKEKVLAKKMQDLWLDLERERKDKGGN